MTALMPVLARIYGLTPVDVWDLTIDEFDAFIEDLGEITNG